MPDQICLVLAEEPSILFITSQLKADILKVASEFGSKCGVFGMLGDTGKNLEKAMKKLIEAYTWLYNKIRDTINTINGMIAEGVALLYGAIQTALELLTGILNGINAVIDNAIDILAKAVKDLASALCSGVKTALTGVPSDVVLSTPGLMFLAYAEANDPREFLQRSLMRQGVDAINDQIQGPLNQLANFQNTYLFPDFATYICTPV